MRKILIIEDNFEIRSNTAELLELNNYIAIEAENGQEGINKAIESSPDLILCDIMMPGLNGYEVLKALREYEGLKSIPFIFLSSKSEKVDESFAIQLGANFYITKPFNCDHLLNIIRKKLDTSDGSDENHISR